MTELEIEAWKKDARVSIDSIFRFMYPSTLELSLRILDLIDELRARDEEIKRLKEGRSDLRELQIKVAFEEGC